MDFAIDELLRRAVESGGSDLHLKVGSPPVVRVDGELRKLPGFETLRPNDTEAIAQAIFTPRAVRDFKDLGEADFAYGRPELGRFRITAYRQRGSVTLVMRRVIPNAESFEALGLPAVVKRLASEVKGLVLVTGPSGSGKSSTMASMVDHINSTRPVAIVTIEDPIEVLHRDKLALVAQREVGVDTVDYAEAIRRAMRQDADVIMVSEIGDHGSAQAAIAAAEAGHMVLSSMRTVDPAETVARFVGFFPVPMQQLIRRQLASHLRGIISQRLLDTLTENGRVLATEVLTLNERVQERILDEKLTVDIDEVLAESEFFGMHTFDQTVQTLVLSRKVGVRAGLPHVRNPHELRARALEAGLDI